MEQISRIRANLEKAGRQSWRRNQSSTRKLYHKNITKLYFRYAKSHEKSRPDPPRSLEMLSDVIFYCLLVTRVSLSRQIYHFSPYSLISRRISRFTGDLTRKWKGWIQRENIALCA